MSEEQIFLNALELPNAAARGNYLDEACGGDARLREQVDELLASHFKSGEFLDVPAAAQINPEQFDDGSSPSYAVTLQSVAMNIDQPADDESDALEFLTPPTRPDSLGRIGHYEVLQVIGKGGFGTVLRAFDDVLQRVVAVKVMAPQLAATSPARKRFLREARTSAQVRHDNVVQVYEVGEQPLPYLVMEFIPGETLQQRLDRIGPLDVPEVLRIGRQIAEGLAAAHATDLIHRDIKPGNVLLEGGQLKVKITDFGLARAADDASMTQSGMIAGTPMYMAPEQVLGQMLDQRADLFSLGTVMYQMAAGRVPFRAPNSVAVLKRVADDTPRNIREVIPETPQWLCDIISKLHAKNPAERYQSARDVADVLADCEAQLKQNSRLRDYSRIPRSGPAATTGKWKWAAVAAAVLLPILALTYTELAGVTNWFRGRQPKVAVGPISSANLGPTAANRANPQTDPASDGFVPLFNGHDLTGWIPSEPDKWKVGDGILVGTARGHLISKQAYQDFHLRAKAKYNGATVGTIAFRGVTQPNGQPIAHGEVSLGNNAVGKTGSAHLWRNPKPENVADFAQELVPADTWFDLDIIVRGNEIVAKVNGKTTASIAPDRLPERGRISLNAYQPGSLIEFSKIEIKELPTSPPVTEGFVALFNGKDLTGWKKHALSGGDWKVEDGAIDGRGTTSYLFTESGDYANFHLQVEAKINGNGDAGVYVRTPFDVRGLPNTTSAKFALLGGYEAAIALRASYPTHTGSLMGADASTLQAGPLLPHKPDEWFVLEVIAEDNQIRTLVDGKPVADYTDDNRRASRGHIVLQTWGQGITHVQFRKVEIKELPASVSPSVGPSLAVAPFDAAQAKQHQEAWAKYLELPVEAENKLGMKLILIPPAGAVLANAYYLGKYEVTQGEWETVMGYNPSSFGTQNPAAVGVSTSKFPVESVGWWDSVEFCNTLSEQEGLTPYYELTVTKRGGKDSKQITAADVKILGGNGYHIPRDVEWTHACAAGAKTKYHFGDKDEDLVEYAWFDANSDERSHRVGEKKPNAFGLYDMHGNVNEWNDRILTNAEIVNPKDAVNRGGAYRWTASQCEIRHWFTFDPKFALSWNSRSIGLRVARDLSGAASPKAKTPPLAIAPFDAVQAKQHQEAWARHLGVPVDHTNSIGMKLRVVPPGRFRMRPNRQVTISKPFQMAAHETTIAQFRAFVDETGYRTSAEKSGRGVAQHIDGRKETGPQFTWQHQDVARGNDYPVGQLSWNDAVAFCQWLSRKEGKSYRLPTEAEWEWAGRGGSATAYHFGNDQKSLGDYAWYAGNSDDHSHSVGQRKPNSWGLYDMPGNVAEYGLDWFLSLEHGDAVDPTGPADGEFRVVRGNGFFDAASGFAFTQRAKFSPGLSMNHFGFRVVCDAVNAAKPEPMPPTYKNSIGMEFVIVPKGKSWLGGGKDKLGDQEVEIPADFYLGKYEVTQEEWEKVMGENPSHFSRTGNGKDAVKDISDADLKRFPVEGVTWDQCQVLVAKLNQRENETGWVYRLPTEAEWEYACRGGPMADKLDSAFDFYFTEPTNILLPDMANFQESGKNRTCNVGSYKPNRLGLNDMLGNVWEWCDDVIPGDPKDPKAASRRVHRGGGCIDALQRGGRSPRFGGAAGYRNIHVGLRLARVPSGAPSPEAKTPPLAINPFTDADVQRIAALPAEQQVAAVVARLRERNPGFEGTATHKIEDGVVTELAFIPINGQDVVTDLSPVRALPGLTFLNLWSCSGLEDLRPLQGLPLTRLIISSLHVSNQVRDLQPLQGMRLTELQLYHCQVQDLRPLKDMPLTRLTLLSRQVRDLEPLKGLPLTTLNLTYCTQIQDFTPLAGLPLSWLHLNDCQVRDLEWLNGMRLTGLSLVNTPVRDLEPLKGMPLKGLSIQKSGVTDLTPLQGMELEEVRLTPKKITQGLDILRNMPGLQKIGVGTQTTEAWPAAEFWERLGKGEFN